MKFIFWEIGGIAVGFFLCLFFRGEINTIEISKEFISNENRFCVGFRIPKNENITLRVSSLEPEVKFNFYIIKFSTFYKIINIKKSLTMGNHYNGQGHWPNSGGGKAIKETKEEDAKEDIYDPKILTREKLLKNSSLSFTATSNLFLKDLKLAPGDYFLFLKGSRNRNHLRI